MDCAEDTETTAKELPAPPAAEEQEAGSPAVAAEKKSTESTAPAEKNGADVEMEDLTLEDPSPSEKEVPSEEPKDLCEKPEEPKDEGKEKTAGEAVVSIDLASSPVPAPLDEAAPKPDPAEDSDSSVELIDSPVKSSSPNGVVDDQAQPDDVDGAAPVDSKPASKEDVETDNKEAEELADSSIELISSPTPDASPTKEEGEGAKEQDVQIPETASESRKTEAEGEIMDVDQEETAKSPADTSEEKVKTADESIKASDSPEKEKSETSADKVNTPMETEGDTNEVALEVQLEKAAEPKAPEDDDNLPADGDTFYGKDCVNCNCKRLHKQYVLANMAILNFYNVIRKGYNQQFVCMDCYDTTMDLYEVKQVPPGLRNLLI